MWKELEASYTILMHINRNSVIFQFLTDVVILIPLAVPRRYVTQGKRQGLWRCQDVITSGFKLARVHSLRVCCSSGSSPRSRRKSLSVEAGFSFVVRARRVPSFLLPCYVAWLICLVVVCIGARPYLTGDCEDQFESSTRTTTENPEVSERRSS